MDVSFSSLKIVAPKLLGGHVLGLPATLVMGSGLGMALVGTMGVVCAGALIVTARIMRNQAKDETTLTAVSTPSL